MAFVGTTAELAIAVCRAGGLGALAVGPPPAEAVRSLIKAVKAATEKPFNVNFITFLANQAQIQPCIDENVSVVSFHSGHPPRGFVAAFHEAGIRLWEQLGSVAVSVRNVPHALRACNKKS
jgi:NAD(P)H-dependent flavin oxidoreductase YrpB (nitropropane dioxygenase family)